MGEGAMVQTPTPPHQDGQKTRGGGQNGREGGRSAETERWIEGDGETSVGADIGAHRRRWGQPFGSHRRRGNIRGASHLAPTGGGGASHGRP